MQAEWEWAATIRPSHHNMAMVATHKRNQRNLVSSPMFVKLRCKVAVNLACQLALLGAVAGGLLGSTIGGGNGKIATTVAGAAVGGYAGNVVQSRQQGATQNGLEISVRLNSGNTVVVTQAADQQFNIGQRVRVVTDTNGTSYVTR